MTPYEIILFLSNRGYLIGIDETELIVEPDIPAGQLADRVKAKSEAIKSYLFGLSYQAATAHKFIALTSADLDLVRENGVCISCGIPWVSHGLPKMSDWDLVSDANDAFVLEASPIEA